MATTEELRDDVHEADEADERDSDEGEESKESGGDARKDLPATTQPKVFERKAGAGLRNVLTITRREFKAYFDSIVAYVVVCLTLLIVGVWFFFFGFWQVERASVSRLFDGVGSLPILLSFLVLPLLTMRALAEEKRSGTIELLITMPVKDSEVILGKFFAALGLTAVLLLCTLIYPFAMFVWPWHMGALDWGPVTTSYVGLLLMGSAGIAVGMMFSSFTENQIVAFFVTAAVLALLWFVGSIVEFVHGPVGDAIAFVSFQTRFLPFARGLVDTRAVIYFLSITIICLLAAFRSLESRKWS
jgi:ABC-2 type transport system permease protein